VLNKKGLLKAFITVFVILFIDQFIKIWIKTHFCLGESYNVFGSSWFIIHFTENNGMAFGMEFAGSFGKILLTLFRIVASILIGWYLYKLIKKRAGSFLIITISLVLAGAVGNIFDCLFYGLIFERSPEYLPWADYPCHPAQMFPAGGGYASFLHGQVVDMLYFPVINTTWPDWMPFWGGQKFIFFSPIFNIADAAITVGVFILLIFQKRLFKKEKEADPYRTIVNNTDPQP
jgi:signal peptidase II